MIRTYFVGDLIPSGLASPPPSEVVDAILMDIATGVRAEWQRLASADSSSFRFDYLNGIQEVEMLSGRAVVSLVGEIPHLLEDGSSAFDLRNTLLGPNVPVKPFGQKGKRLGKKGQFYRAIPFRHTNPNAGKTLGQPMGSAYQGHEAISNAKKLGKSVYGEAKQLAATVGAPYQQTVWGGKLDTSSLGPGGGLIPLLKSHHKTDIYSGMYKMQKTYESATQSQYMTFRTISTNVTTGWIRKPIRARHYAANVADYAAKIAPTAFSAYFGGKE